MHLISHQSFLCPLHASNFELCIVPQTKQCVFTVLCICSVSEPKRHLSNSVPGRSICASWPSLRGASSLDLLDHCPPLKYGWLLPNSQDICIYYCLGHTVVITVLFSCQTLNFLWERTGFFFPESCMVPGTWKYSIHVGWIMDWILLCHLFSGSMVFTLTPEIRFDLSIPH